MGYFIIGDVHGCYYTLCHLLQHWDASKEELIFVGDLIDRGHFSAKVLTLCMELTQQYEAVVVLKGNHEAELIQYIQEGGNENWTRQGGDLTVLDFEKHGLVLESIVSWLVCLPLRFEKEHFIVTHAGITHTEDPFLEEGDDSVLWNRKPLRNLGKLQLHGHTPLQVKQAKYCADSNSWNLDTGAYYGYGLTAIRLSDAAEILEHLTIPTDPRDSDKISLEQEPE